MTDAQILFYYDFTDPLSYLTALELERAAGERADAIRWIPFELRPPPTPLVLATDESLADRWSEARRLAPEVGVDFHPAELVPWTRKAHELIVHAEADEAADVRALRTAVFEAALLEGRDIGRVDVLVDLARSAGLATTETKAVLDVDRYEADVAASRSVAADAGVTETPTVVRGERRLEGFHNRTVLGTFLGT